jgi:hypothetical protein
MTQKIRINTDFKKYFFICVNLSYLCPIKI